MSGKKKIDPRDYVVPPDAEISTIDLDREEFTLRDGRRLTEELAEQLARQAQDEIRQRNLVPGRKSVRGRSALADHSRARTRTVTRESRAARSRRGAQPVRAHPRSPRALPRVLTDLTLAPHHLRG